VIGAFCHAQVALIESQKHPAVCLSRLGGALQLQTQVDVFGKLFFSIFFFFFSKEERKLLFVATVCLGLGDEDFLRF
jgi:hypothetical protein